MNSLIEFWQSLGTLQGNVIAACLSIVVPMMAYYLQPSVKLRWGRANVSYHDMKKAKDPLNLCVEKYYLQNSGRKPAHNVEFVFNYEPEEVSVWEPRNYTPSKTPEGNHVLNIPQIAPKEFIIIDTIYVNRQPAIIVSVKCADCVGKQVNFRVQRYFGKWFEFVAGALFLFGTFYAAKLIISLFLK